jgi:hypothetical protein
VNYIKLKPKLSAIRQKIALDESLAKHRIKNKNQVNTSTSAKCSHKNVFFQIFSIIGGLILSLVLIIFGGAFFGFVEQMRFTPRHHFGNSTINVDEGREIFTAAGAAMSIVVIALAVFILVLSIVHAYLLSIVVRGYQFLKQDAPPEYDRLVEEAKFSTQG